MSEQPQREESVQRAKGIHDGITEVSISHGHGPSRYRRNVERFLEDEPDEIVRMTLIGETCRWDSGVMSDEYAKYLLEVLDLKKEYLGEDIDERKRTLKDEFDLE